MPTTALAVEELTCCPLCGHAAADPVLEEADGYLPSLRLHRCRGCTMVYLNPRLTLDAMVAVEDESEVYAFGPDVAEQWITGGLIGLVAQLEGHLRTPGRRLLDIGCNRGLLMEAARRRGWQVRGVEISPESANRARRDYGLIVYATLDALAEAEPGARFDLITAWHVLEHTFDPVAFLRAAAARLAPQGVLALQVPSFDFLDEFRRRNEPGSLLCAVHNFYFTEANLQPVLARAGLAPLQVGSDPNSLLLTAICTRPAQPRSWWRRIQARFAPHP